MTEATASVERTLGELLAEVRNLKSTLDDHQEKSDKSRAALHQRVDTLVDRVGKTESSVNEVKKDIGEMKPVTDDVMRWKLIGIGALGVTGLAFTAIGVTFADVLRRLFLAISGH
jgi:ElaB/YqjD/DUF883 family membrane-anchored ribosome-binding protein